MFIPIGSIPQNGSKPEIKRDPEKSPIPAIRQKLFLPIEGVCQRRLETRDPRQPRRADPARRVPKQTIPLPFRLIEANHEL